MNLLRNAVLGASVLVASASPAAATTYNVGSSANSDGGIMFDMSVRDQAITLNSLGIYTSLSGAPTSATVYMRKGSFQGFSGSSADWTNLGSFNLTKPLTNTTNLLDFDDVSLDANTTYGIFVTLSGSTSTLATGGFSAAGNGVVSLSANGLGKRGFNGFTNIQRSFYGAINYTITPPAAAVTPVPEPATWAMMLVGFGVFGAASRYRRRGANFSKA